VTFWLLDRAHVAAVPGSGFGQPGYVRFSYAASEERIAAGIAAIQRVVEDAWQVDRTGRTQIKL
jgi:aspartate aminotransferase